MQADSVSRECENTASDSDIVTDNNHSMESEAEESGSDDEAPSDVVEPAVVTTEKRKIT